MSDIKQRFSSFRLVCLLSLAVLAAGLASCQESETAAEVREVVITADSIAELAPGEKLIIDRSHGTVYTFDFFAAPIDFSRIAILMEDGNEVAMDRWLNSSEDGSKLLASPNRVFRLASNKQSLERLPSLKDRNIKPSQQDVLVCVTVCQESYQEIVICNSQGCVVFISYSIACEERCEDVEA